jgi:acyl dehydratase
MTTTLQEQIYFEDVKEGMALPSKTKGPITITHLVKFAGASGDYSPLHHDQEYSKNVARLPDVILHGQAKLAFMVHLVTDWIGIHGRVKKIGASYRGMDILGDTVISNGKVIRVYCEEGECLVDLELWNANDRTGNSTAVGTATISLPCRSP